MVNLFICFSHYMHHGERTLFVGFIPVSDCEDALFIYCFGVVLLKSSALAFCGYNIQKRT